MKKRSSKVNLVVLGTLSLVIAGCDDSPDTVMQNNYASKEACIKDWGTDPSRCTQSSGGAYLGPRYFWNHSGGVPMIYGSGGEVRPATNSFISRGSSYARSVSSFSVARGGFGATGGGHGSSSGG